MPYTLTQKDAVWYINGVQITLPRDQNFDPVALLAGIDDTGKIVPLLLAPTTNGLLVHLDGTTEVEIKNDIGNPVPVTIVAGAPGAGTPIFAEHTIAPSVEDVLISFTPGTDSFIISIFGTGQSDAIYDVYLDAVRILTGKGNVAAPNFTAQLNGSIKVSSGHTLEVHVTNTYVITAKYAVTVIVR